MIGQKRFLLNLNDQRDYMIVISAKLLDAVVRANIFDVQETYSIL